MKKIIILLLFVVNWALGQSSILIEPNANNGILSKNTTTVTTNPGSVALPASGAGTRLMWIPAKSAFRVGTVVGTQWDAANVGTWSFAANRSTTASGNYAVSMGYGTYATGESATSLGFDTHATGDNSTSTGALTYATGINSISMGYQSSASGRTSTSTGRQTVASGDYSATFGFLTKAKAQHSVAMGYHNIEEGTVDADITTDPLFVVGNGTLATPNNALTLLKNGNLGLDTPIPSVRLHIAGSEAEKIHIENTTTLASNINAEMYFKTGLYFTGGIKTIGSNSQAARMGFFTFAGGNTSSLLERLTILDAGNVGISNTNPQEKLHITGNIRSSNLAGTGNREVYTDANGTLRSNPLCAFSITGMSGGSNFIPNNGTQYEDIIVNLEEYDLGNNFNPSSGIFTAPIKGIYHFEGTFTVLGSTATSGDHTLYLRVTPVSSVSENKVIARTPVVTNQSITPRITADLLLNANETVKLIIVNNANVVQTLVGANNSSRFSGRLTMVVN